MNASVRCQYSSVQKKYLNIALQILQLSAVLGLQRTADTLVKCIAVQFGFCAFERSADTMLTAVQIKMNFAEVQCQMALGRLPARTIMMMENEN